MSEIETKSLLRFLSLLRWGGGGCSPKKDQKTVATPKSVNWHCFFLFFWYFWFFWFFKISKLALVFFGFFGIGFGQNSKLKTGFFGF